MDALQLFAEVILLPLTRRVFQPLVVHGETLHQILIQVPYSPLAKLRAAMAAHTETDREDGVQIVVLDLPRHLPFPFDSNYPEFPDCCLPAQFSLVKNVDQVLIDRSHIFLKQLCQEGLRQPQGLILKPTLDAGPAILRLVKNDFRIG